jgi:ribosome-associated toxin RatA of RatAB toxin-antitoxin module
VTLTDEHLMLAPPDTCFRIARDVEQWPRWLRHYRRVRFLTRDGDAGGRVEMAAWRDFTRPIRYPTWWVSDMRTDPIEPAIYFRHVDGITRGMDVKWSFSPAPGGTLVCITHAWEGPAWPLIGGLAWRSIIAPHFVSAIAQRTLAGIAREAERLHHAAVRDASNGRTV